MSTYRKDSLEGVIICFSKKKKSFDSTIVGKKKRKKKFSYLL